MSQIRKRATIWGAILVPLLAIVAWAGINIDASAQLTATPAQTAATSGSQLSTLGTTVISGFSLDMLSNPQWNVTADFSAAGATASCYVRLLRKTGASTYDHIGVAAVVTFTATAGPAVTADGLYPALEVVGGDIRSATHIELRTIEAVSSGTVKYRAWGSAAQPGGM